MTQTRRQKHSGGPEAAVVDTRRTRRSAAKRRRLFWAGSVVAIVGLVAYGLFATGLLGNATAAGELAPDVSLSTANGEYHLAQQRGKVVVLYFSFPG